MIVTFVLCYSFPVVHASETKISDLYFFNSILNSDDASEKFSGSPYDIFLADQNFRNIFYDKETAMGLEETLNIILDKTVDVSSLNSPYCTILTTDNTNFRVYFHTGNFDAYSNYSNLNVNITNCIWYNYNVSNDAWVSMGSSDLHFSSSSRCVVLLSTAPLYYRWNPTQATVDMNYMLADGDCGDGQGGLNIVPPYPDESADNNLVFAQSDFIFTHQTYYAPYSSSVNTGSAVPVGTISFKGQPNDYQLEHPEEFTLQIRFVFEYDVDYKNQTGSEVSYFKKTSTLLNNEKNLRINFGNSQPYFIPLTTFIQNKNNADFVIKDVFDNLYSDGNSLTGLLAQSKEITSLSYNKFLITCYANIIANNQTSGGYIENYNFNSRMGATTTNNIETNPNPYTPKPSDQASDDPDTSNITPKPNVPGPGGSDETTSPSTNTTTTTSNGGSQIVITNSPTFNNNSSASSNATSNGNGGGMIPTLLSYLSNGQQSSVSTMQNVADTNGWLNVVNSTYTFVPVSVWNSLIFYFGIALSILIVGFIISVVIKFIT